MNKLINDYLNRTYELTISSKVRYHLFNKITKETETIKRIFIDLEKIFSVSNDELLIIFHAWIDIKDVELNNKIVDIKTRVYQEIGVVVDVFGLSLGDQLLLDSGEEGLRSYINRVKTVMV